jgi:hypothetical protein
MNVELSCQADADRLHYWDDHMMFAAVSQALKWLDSKQLCTDHGHM